MFWQHVRISGFHWFLALIVASCSSGVQAAGINRITPLPPTSAAVSAPTPGGTAVAMIAPGGELQGDPPYKLAFNQMYSGRSIREGLVLSDYLKALNGKQVSMEGYMAPPLKPSLTFFVLTEVPMALCPFCSSNADWPDNIILVYLDSQTTQPTSHPIRVTGRLEIGSQVDQETGFVSMVRLYADRLEIVG